MIPRFAALFLMLGVGTLITAGPVLSAPSTPYRLSVYPGTPLEISAARDVDSGSLKSGDLVLFVVTKPVVVNGVTVVATSAAARGVAVYSRAARVGGRGELLVEVEDVAAVDGTWIPLRVRAAEAKGLADLIPEECMDLAEPVFPKGRNGLLSSKRVLKAWTAAPQDFMVRPGGQSPRVAAAPLVSPPGVAGTPVRLVEGTPVTIRPASEIVSDQVHTGDSVKFLTTRAVIQNGRTVIAAGASVVGTVLLARASAAANHPGELVLGIDSVVGVDGRPILLRLSSASAGSTNRAISFGLSAVVPLAGLAVHGRNAVVPVGHEFVVAVVRDCLVMVPPGSGM